MKRKLVNLFLSDTLLLGFALVMLLIFVLMAVAPDNVVALWEGNPVILFSEIGICIFAAIWAISRVVKLIRKGRQLIEV